MTAVTGPGVAEHEQRGAPATATATANNRAPLRLRILSAMVLIPAALAVFYIGGWLFCAVMVVIAALMAHEWERITGGGITPIFGYQIIGFLLIAVVTVLGEIAVAAVVAAMLLAAILWQCRRWERDPLWASLGFVYVALPLVAILWLRQVEPLGLALILWLMVMVWATDIGAFVVGKAVGGPRLAPRISPRKTWSGLLGGMVFSALFGAGLGVALGLPLAALALMLIGVAVAAWAQLGDLAESAIKRRFGVKDSGSIIPGHGGVLDRVDGLVFAAPLIALGVALFWA